MASAAMGSAKVDYFLKIDGISGESYDAAHPREIQLLSWSFGEHNSGTFAAGGGGGAGKVEMGDFHFTKYVDTATPPLMQCCCTGKHIQNAVLTCRKAGKTPQEYLKVTFRDLLISSMQQQNSSGDAQSVESISFNFAGIRIEYREQKADGTLGGATLAEFNLKAMAERLQS